MVHADWRSVVAELLLLLMLAVGATIHGFLPDRILAPADVILTSPPWQGTVEEAEPRNFLLFDQAVQFAPWREFATRRLREGELPLWNPHQQLGTPFLANGQSAVCFPTTLIHLALPREMAWTLDAVVRLFFAGLGAWLLARSFGLSAPGRVTSGALFMLCGYHIAWLQHPHSNCSIFLPWIFLAGDALRVRVTALRITALGFLIGLMLLGGHPGSMIHVSLAAAVYLIMRLHGMERRSLVQASAGLGAALVLGMLLSAVQWLPLLDYVSDSGAASVHGSVVPPFQLWPLLGMAFPYLGGYPPDACCTPEFQQAMPIPNASELANGYTGVAALVLAWCTCRRGAPATLPVRALCVTAVLAAIMACNVPGVSHLVRLLPGLGQTNNSRMIFVAALCIGLFAGAGIDRLGQGVSKTMPLARTTILLRWASVTFLVAALAGWTILHFAEDKIVDYGRREVDRRYAADKGEAGQDHPREFYYERVDDIHGELCLIALRGVIPGLALGLLALALQRSRGRRRWCLVAIVLLEEVTFAVPYNRGSTSAEWYPPSGVTEFLAAQEAAEPSRFVGLRNCFYADVATFYGLHDVRGYDAVSAGRLWRWLQAIDEWPDPMNPYSNRVFHPERPAMNLLALRYVLVAADQPEPFVSDGWRQVSSIRSEAARGCLVYENENALPMAWIAPSSQVVPDAEILPRVASYDFDPQAVVLLEHSSGLTSTASESPPGRILARTRPDPEAMELRIANAADQWLVLSEAFATGWTAHVEHPGGSSDAVDVVPAYGVLQALQLPSWCTGEVTVRLSYRPTSVRIGAWLTAVGTFLLLCFSFVGMLRWGRAPQNR